MKETRLKTRNPDGVRLVCILDPHLSPNNPPAFKQDYWPIAQEAMRSAMRFARQQNVDAIVHGGDLFHLKTASRNPTWFVEEVMALLQESGDIPHIGIAGNHDIKFGNIQEGLKGQPLSVLVTAGIFHLLDHEEWYFEAQDHTTKLAGGSYHHAEAEHVRGKTKDGADHLISIGHFWFGPQSGKFFGEPIYGPDYLSQSEVDMYVIGHHHEDQGVQILDGKIYASHGSLSRTGAHKGDINRRPSASFITSTASGLDIKVLRPKYPSADDTIDFEKREQIQKEKEEISSFLEQLNSVVLSSQDPKDILEEISPSDDVRQRALEYLEKAETELT